MAERLRGPGGEREDGAEKLSDVKLSLKTNPQLLGCRVKGRREQLEEQSSDNTRSRKSWTAENRRRQRRGQNPVATIGPYLQRPLQLGTK